jgi:hypothetical protein
MAGSCGRLRYGLRYRGSRRSRPAGRPATPRRAAPRAAATRATGGKTGVETLLARRRRLDGNRLGCPGVPSGRLERHCPARQLLASSRLPRLASHGLALAHASPLDSAPARLDPTVRRSSPHPYFTRERMLVKSPCAEQVNTIRRPGGTNSTTWSYLLPARSRSARFHASLPQIPMQKIPIQNVGDRRARLFFRASCLFTRFVLRGTLSPARPAAVIAWAQLPRHDLDPFGAPRVSSA